MVTPRVLIVVALAATASAQGPISVRVLLGATDAESKTWDGGVRSQGGNIVTIEPWRFEGSDALDGNRWRMSTHSARRFGGANQPEAPIVANGIILTLAGPNATLDFETAQGNFQVRTDELSYGRFVSKLDGRVLVDRIPVTNRIARTVVLANSDLIDKLGVAVPPSIPWRASFVGSLRRCFRFLSQPCGASA